VIPIDWLDLARPRCANDPFVIRSVGRTWAGGWRAAVRFHSSVPPAYPSPSLRSE
jgi:hypothetical protein